MIIEPRTITRLPLRTADDAEFRHAAAGHVVAAFFALDKGAAAVAALPAFLFCLLDQLCDFGVLGTFGRAVHLPVARGTDFSFAPCAEGVLASLDRVHVARSFDPLTAFEVGAVDAVFCIELLVFGVPEFLELDIEDFVNVFERNVLVAAAFRWHVCWVFDGHLEDAFETVLTHAMATR